MQAHDVIRKLQATSSRLEKEQILIDAWMNGCVEFFAGALLATDKLVSFGVKKVAEILDEDDGTPSSYGWAEFEPLCRALMRRELTGTAARDAIHEHARRAPTAAWNEFYRRILLKDLRSGVDEKTITKVLLKLSSAYPEAKKYIVPVFGCQLAHDSAKHPKKMRGEKLVDVKLDGVRLLTVLDKENGTVRQFARNGKENVNFSRITDSLAKLLPSLPGSIVLDGEIVGESFQDLMTQFSRKSDVDTTDAKLALFDLVPLADFRAGFCKTPQIDRHSVLTELEVSGALRTHCDKSVYVIPKMLLDLDTEEGQARYTEFNRDAVEAGLEGVMIKDPVAPYECKRSAAWLKSKPFLEVSLEVVGFEEGTGKYVGMMGNMICRGVDDGRAIEVSVGSGFSDEQRQNFWDRRTELIGYIVEIRADKLTQDRATGVWSLRFPRWKGFRGSEAGEKL